MSLNADYAVPSADEIGEWVATAYELREVPTAEVQRLEYPLLYSVGVARATYWLRVYSPGHPSHGRLEAQARAILAARGNGATLARPVAGRNRRLVQVADLGGERRFAILFTQARGRGLRRSELREVSAFGAAIARLHGAPGHLVDARLANIDFDHLAAVPLERLAQCPAADSVVDQVRKIAQHIGPHMVVGTPLGLCHGDVHPQNANVDTDGTVTLFDFDELGYGPFAYDLACYWRNAVLTHGFSQAATDEWEAFLEGYAVIRPVTDQERLAVPALATLRAIWTMAMPARYVDIWGADWLADPTYFEAHLTMIHRFAARS